MRFHRSSTLVLCLLAFISEFTEISSKKTLFLRKFKIPNKRTNSPINIKTKKAIKVNYPPLIFRIRKKDKVKVINTGKSVDVVENDPSLETSITGGVFQNDTYIFDHSKFFWVDNKNGVSATRINGKGFPLETVGYSYNSKYKTFNNSLHYRDGIATFVFPVNICHTPNKNFPPFAKKLKKVLRAKSSASTQLGISLVWHGLLPKNTTYYAYPGSYRDENNGKKYFCETVLVPDSTVPCISGKQFDGTFGLMKNSFGKPLTSTHSTYPFRQPVVIAKGVIFT